MGANEVERGGKEISKKEEMVGATVFDKMETIVSTADGSLENSGRLS